MKSTSQAREGTAAAWAEPSIAAAAGRSFDPAIVRADFPIFRTPREQPLRYLDSAATSQKPDAVLAAMDHYYAITTRTSIAASTRSRSRPRRPTRTRARKLAGFIHAHSPREIVFTRNSTEAINLVAHSWGRFRIHAGDAILLTEMEHHSNLVPWQILAQERQIELRFIPVTSGGELDLERLPGLLADGKVKLVGVVHISNVLGTINPIAEIARAAHEAGALMLVDASQSVPHCPVDVRALGADFLAFTSHKMLGPTGIGALWAGRELLEAMPPLPRRR